MDDYALVLNAGSSSLKFCVYRRPDSEKWRLEARGQIRGHRDVASILRQGRSRRNPRKNNLDDWVSDGRAALDVLASWLRSKYGGARVLGVGHRVVHGGARYAQPTIVTRQVLAELYELVPLAPLHQPHNLAAIETIFERMPGVPQVACFDTSFHSGHSPVAKLIPLPREICKSGLQRYGFHGLSYEYVASVLPEVAPEIARGRVIVAHLGSGASLCALKDGKSVDSSLGFTALDGLCMGTRPGAIDPALSCISFRASGCPLKKWRPFSTRNRVCWGSQASVMTCATCLPGVQPEARLAVDYFVYRAAKEIGALAAVLGGVDGLVFTAGIGENSPEIRRRICEASAWLGVELDARANTSRGARISTSAKQSLGLGHSHQRRTHDRTAHRRASWIDRGHRRMRLMVRA